MQEFFETVFLKEFFDFSLEFFLKEFFERVFLLQEFFESIKCIFIVGQPNRLCRMRYRS